MADEPDRQQAADTVIEMTTSMFYGNAIRDRQGSVSWEVFYRFGGVQMGLGKAADETEALEQMITVMTDWNRGQSEES